jgi:hypothetical protein
VRSTTLHRTTDRGYPLATRVYIPNWDTRLSQLYP